MLDNKTMQRKPWSQKEDQALKCLYESLRINKWSHIAIQLHQQFGFAPRTGKQCRERYNNHLDPALCRDNWTIEEEKILFDLHDKMGNKWAIISQSLGPGRTDNSVKNHYFSRLRKSLRRLNKVIYENYKKQVRQIQTKVLYKIIEASQQMFKVEPMCDYEVSEYACKLKNKILLFSYEEEEQNAYLDSAIVKDLIREIVQFNKNYKRKPKNQEKLNKQSASIPVSGNSQYNFIQFSDSLSRSFLAISKNQLQDISDNLSNEDLQDDINRSMQTIEKQKIISPIILTSNRKIMDEKQFKQEPKNSEQILQALGLLEDDIPAPHPALMKKKTSIVSSEHLQENEEFKFFDDSEIEMRAMCAPLLVAVKKESEEDRLFN